MRFALNCLVALMLAGILAGVVLSERSGDNELAQLDEVRAEVARFQQQIVVQSALITDSPTGYAESIDPDWFHGDMPSNVLVEDHSPWVEIAGRAQASMQHPPDRVALDDSIARFWYNPYQGIVRARVPGGISDAKALDWYNYINDCQLPSIFADQ